VGKLILIERGSFELKTVTLQKNEHMKSLDPRVNRMNLPEGESKIDENSYWESFEVFHQKKTGAAFAHVGSLDAPNKEMAMILAKEQFGRRQKTTGMWVVKSTDIFALESEEMDIFSTTPEKSHREATDYKVRDKIIEFNNKNKDA